MNVSPVSIALGIEDKTALDIMAVEANVSRSEIIRRLIRTKRKSAGLKAAERKGARLGRQVFQANQKIIRGKKNDRTRLAI